MKLKIVIDNLIIKVLIVSLFAVKSGQSLLPINYDHLDQLTYSFEPKFLFNFEFNVPLSSLIHKSNVIATINLPMTITIKEEEEEEAVNAGKDGPQEASADQSSALLSFIKSRQKFQSLPKERPSSFSSTKAPFAYPAYIPIYYDDPVYDPEYETIYQVDSPLPGFFNNTSAIDNTTDRTDYNHRSRKFSFQRTKRNHDGKTDFNQFIESNTWLGGNDCLFRLICHISRSKLIGHNTIESLINLSKLIQSNGDSSILIGPFQEAEQFGRISGNCEEKYSNCS